MYKVGLIGFGYWGPNLARNINNHPKFELAVIAEQQESRQRIAENMFARTRLVNDGLEVCRNPELEVVIIATPAEFHFKFAKEALDRGKHVMVEKPAGKSLRELQELHELARRKNKVLLVDYTFLYHGAVQKINQIVNEPSFGRFNYMDATRINLGIFQQDVNVIWDLASHDIAIVNYLTKKLPSSVKADGISHTNNGIENIAYLTLKYEDTKFMVHLSCSWTSPVKIRQLLIGGDNKMLIYNDIEPTDKIKVYDTNLNFSQQNRSDILIDYRIGDISIPKFNTEEALSGLVEDLYQSIVNNKQALSSSAFALQVSAILEAAQKSIQMQGTEVDIDYL
ncbi:MAG: Gfo/Idh/MocA family oxidoreductase [Bacteroidia bacterium]|nr:Gfo/Idh/MocA family oxidoreductase [Bacteroidia bacterium]